jgi:hypothetical protein
MEALSKKGTLVVEIWPSFCAVAAVAMVYDVGSMRDIQKISIFTKDKCYHNPMLLQVYPPLSKLYIYLKNELKS